MPKGIMSVLVILPVIGAYFMAYGDAQTIDINPIIIIEEWEHYNINWFYYGGSGSLERIRWFNGTILSGEHFMTFTASTGAISTDPRYEGQYEYITGTNSAGLKIFNISMDDANDIYSVEVRQGGVLFSDSTSVTPNIQEAGKALIFVQDLSFTLNGIGNYACDNTAGTIGITQKSDLKIQLTLKDPALVFPGIYYTITLNIDTSLNNECRDNVSRTCDFDVSESAWNYGSNLSIVIEFEDATLHGYPYNCGDKTLVGELDVSWLNSTTIIAGVCKASGVLVALTVGLTEGLLQPWLNVWQLYPCGCHCAVLILWVPVAVYVALAAVNMVVVEFLVCQNSTDPGGPYITDPDQEVCRGLNFGLGGVAIAALLIFGAVAYVLWIQKGSSKTDNPDGSDTGGSYRKSLMILWITTILAAVIIIVAMVCLLVLLTFSEPDEPSFPATLIVKIIWIVYLLVYGLVIFFVAIYPFKKGKGHSVSDAGQDPGDLNKTRTSSPTATASEIDVFDHPKQREETTSFGGGRGIHV